MNCHSASGFTSNDSVESCRFEGAPRSLAPRASGARTSRRRALARVSETSSRLVEGASFHASALEQEVGRSPAASMSTCGPRAKSQSQRAVHALVKVEPSTKTPTSWPSRIDTSAKSMTEGFRAARQTRHRRSLDHRDRSSRPCLKCPPPRMCPLVPARVGQLAVPGQAVVPAKQLTVGDGRIRFPADELDPGGRIPPGRRDDESLVEQG